ncbi:MAG: hypothetical protein Q9207_001396 [Kuettlingeria erythrocarpa]
MALSIPRIHFYEIDDQSWFPSILREKVQACLTLLWIKRFPPFQSRSPASLIAHTLQSLLGPTIKDYIFIDFASGAGGPTPRFEHEINKALALESIERYHQKQKGLSTATKRRKDANAPANGDASHDEPDKDTTDDPSVDFILTDLFPHIPSWKLACSTSPHLHYIPQPIDACSTPRDLTSLTSSPQPLPPRKPFHLFSLAFHHFPDPLARAVLRNALRNSSGFAILELQSRSLSGLFTALMLGPVLWLTSWYHFWGDWTHLFWSYVVPVVPVVVVLDGLVSALRTRTTEELLALMDDEEREGWRFESGAAMHTWPTGEATWFVGIREG